MLTFFAPFFVKFRDFSISNLRSTVTETHKSDQAENWCLRQGPNAGIDRQTEVYKKKIQKNKKET